LDKKDKQTLDCPYIRPILLMQGNSPPITLFFMQEFAQYHVIIPAENGTFSSLNNIPST